MIGGACIAIPCSIGCCKQAFAANDNLKIAEANLAAARALLEAAKVGRYPQTVARAGGVYGRDPGTEEILEIDGHRPSNLWVFDDILDVSYEVDLFGHVRRSIEASRADAEATAAVRDRVKITVAAETTRAYAQICTLGEQLAVARHSLEVVSREAEITVQGHEEGAKSEFDVVRAEGLVAKCAPAFRPWRGRGGRPCFNWLIFSAARPLMHRPPWTLAGRRRT